MPIIVCSSSFGHPPKHLEPMYTVWLVVLTAIIHKGLTYFTDSVVGPTRTNQNQTRPTVGPTTESDLEIKDINRPTLGK